MKTLGFLAVYVALYLSGVTGYGRSKEGKCPPPPKAVNCARRMFTSDATPCFYQDLECPGTQKCCDDGCDGKACVLAIGLPKLPVVEPCNFKGSTTSAGGACRAKNVTYCSKFGCKECCIHTSTCSPLPGVYIKRAECEKQLCKDESCPGQGQICVMDKYHRASCVCRQQCPKNFKGSRVCGSDKVTYENECRMNITACVLGVRINVIFPGPCDQRNENPLAICDLAKDPGHGDMRYLRYYFHKKKGICEAFIYYGKKGNRNNFKNFQDCDDRCSKAVKDVCVLPKVVGSCRAAFPRWYFNTRSGLCERFTYGGCAGNANNFRTREQCEAHCGAIPEKNICDLPKAKGRCKGKMRRWFYNKASGKCQWFNYGGCGGNENNFKILRECRIACAGGFGFGRRVVNPFVPRCEDGSKFTCRSIKKCIPVAKRCNGKNDCGDNSDEENCKPVVKDPCYGVTCDFYATCVSTKNGTVLCECPKICPPVKSPVCGSDNETYPNLCTMKVQSCEKQQLITKKSDGECATGTRTKCQEEYDSTQKIPGAFVVQCEDDGSYSEVQCHSSTGICWCVDQDGVKVDGTEALRNKPNCTPPVTVTTTKPFDICEITLCDFGKCVNINGTATCQCDLNCPRIDQPLCGSDNNTYPNLCVMEAKACETKQFISVRHDGPCDPRPKSPCELQRDAVPQGLIGGFRVQCEEDGSYSKVQCHAGTGYCWCVDEKGVKLPGTDIRSQEPNCYGNKSKSKCEKERDSVDSNLVGAFKVQCEEDGSYSKVQCHGSTGYCWCVDEQGRKLENTAVRHRPNCSDTGGGVTCDDITCKFYSTCITAENGTALCQCPQICTADYNPVCGSDKKTYPNLCGMRVESCKKLEMITKKSDGKCDPCEGVSCDFHASCVPNDNGTALCECPKFCTFDYSPVCGSDNKTYSNLCAMKSESCEKQQMITKQSDGECVGKDPCEGVSCEFYATCVALKNGSTTCQCPQICTKEYNPVCGSDNKTYSTECIMKVTSCEKQELIVATSYGECPKQVTEPSPEPIPKQKSKCQKEVEALPDPTPPGTFVPQCEADGSYSKAQCDGSTAYCWCVDEQGAELEGTRLRFKEPNCTDVEQKTICERRRDSDPLPSPGKFVPQCDQDGSYSEIQCHGSTGYCWCVDELGNTREGTEVRLKKPNCEDPCKNVSCKFYATCVALKNGSTTCQCPEICTFEYNPVCGSNNRTYATECVLKVDSCEKQELIMVKSYGECPKPDVIPTISPCATVQCKFHSQCKLVDGKAKCVCHKGCTREYDPKCGSDGVTYSNPCELRRAACEQMKDIAVAKNGECEITPTVSPCESVKCGFYSQCKVVDGKAKCVCHKGCTREYDPKCGSDGVTYSNPCELRKAACEQMTDITVAKNGKCEKPNVAAVLPQCTTCPISLPQKVEKRFRNSYSKFVITGEVVDVRRDESREEMEISVNISKRYKPRNPGKANLKKRDVVKIKIRKLKQGCRCDNLNFEKNVNYVFMGKWKKDKTLVVSTKYGFVQKATDDVVARLKKAKKRSYQRRNYRG